MLTGSPLGVEDEGTALSCSNQPSEETDTQEAQTNAVLGGSTGVGHHRRWKGGHSPCNPVASISVSHERMNPQQIPLS